MMNTQVTSLDQLTRLIEQQLERLSSIQKDIGSATTERQEQLVTALSSTATCIHNEVDKVQQIKQDTLNQIQDTQKSILSYKKLMGEFASNTAVLNPSKSLSANLSDLIQEKQQVEQRYNARLEHVNELYLQLEEFKKALGDFVNTSMMMSSDVDVSSLAVNALEEEISRCEIEYANQKTRVEEGVAHILQLWVLMGLEPQSDQDKLIHQFYHEQDPEKRMNLFHQLVSEDITTRIKQLEEQRQQVEFRKEEIGQNLKHLWNRLHMDPQECETFLMTNRGFTFKELQNYEIELERMLKLKHERMGDFIQTSREELKSLWDQLYYSDKQRARFAPAHTDEFSDAILEAHENEISRLQLETEDSKYILELIEKHMRLKKEIQEFEAITRDPNRLFGKGQRDPGRLLREEKFRKRISRELPKVTKELEGALLEFEALKGYPFLVYGQPYFDVIYGNDLKQENEKPQEPVAPPRTPKREAMHRKPLTSPRRAKTKPSIFNTPQPNRMRQVQLSQIKERKYDTSTTILHRVRETNLRNQKVIKRGHIFDESEEEEVVVPQRIHHKRMKPSHSQSDSDDNIGLDLGIFDDGPDLSDMSEAEDV